MEAEDEAEDDWVDSLDDVASVKKTVMSLERLVVRYRTKIVQNGPRAHTAEDMETIADWQTRVRVSEAQLVKLRKKLIRMEGEKVVRDDASRVEDLDLEDDAINRRKREDAAAAAAMQATATQWAASMADADGTEAKRVAGEGQAETDTVPAVAAAAVTAGKATDNASAAAATAPATTTAVVALDPAVEQERVALLKTAADVKQLWLRAQSTSLERGKTGNSLRKHESVQDLLRNSADTLDTLSGKTATLQDTVSAREQKLTAGKFRAFAIRQITSPGVSAVGAAAAGGADGSKENPGFLSSVAGALSPLKFIPGGLVPSFLKGAPGAGAGDAVSKEAAMAASYVELQRLLVDMLAENIAMRTQLNHYSEALLAPALERDAEFRRKFEESGDGEDQAAESVAPQGATPTAPAAPAASAAAAAAPVVAHEPPEVVQKTAENLHRILQSQRRESTPTSFRVHRSGSVTVTQNNDLAAERMARYESPDEDDYVDEELLQHYRNLMEPDAKMHLAAVAAPTGPARGPVAPASSAAASSAAASSAAQAAASDDSFLDFL